jgi:hypothetical protein
LAEYRTLYNLDRFMTLQATITGAEPTDPGAGQAAQQPLAAGNIEGGFSRNVVAFSLGAGDLSPMAKVDLPGIASKQAALRVILHNPGAIGGTAGSGIADRDADAGRALKPESFIGFPMLNQRGMRRLIAGTFEESDPDTITVGGDPCLNPAPQRSRLRPLTHPSVERALA